MTAKRSSSGRGKRGTTQPDTAREDGHDSKSVKSRGASDKRNGRADKESGLPGTVGAPEPAGPLANSRARDLPPDLHREAAAAVLVAARIELIHDWMLRGWYLKGKTDKLLAALWGVARSTVWGYSAHAVRLLRGELSSRTREELLAELLARIGSIGQDALERTEEVVTVAGEVVEVRRPDHRTALRAAEAAGELLGLKVNRHEHRIAVESLTTEQIHEQLRAHGYQVQPPSTDTTGEEITERETAQNDGDEG